MKIENLGLHMGLGLTVSILAFLVLSGAAIAQTEQETIRSDAQTFAAFYDSKLESLKLALKAKDKEQVKALEDRIHAEECRFLTRAIWSCRQVQALAGHAAELQTYLETYRTTPAKERLKARLGLVPGQVAVCKLVLEKIDGPASRVESSMRVASTPLPPSVPRTSKLRKRDWDLQPDDAENAALHRATSSSSDTSRIASVIRANSGGSSVGLSSSGSSVLDGMDMGVRASSIRRPKR